VSKSTKVSTSSRPTLAEFIMDKKRAACAICRLPAAIRSELSDARKKRYSRAEQIEWLQTVFKIKITTQDFQTHQSGQHEAS
jgi:hypothetical protein